MKNIERYIFLDIDGVIATYQSNFSLDPEKQNFLGILIKVTV